ncbi:MAG: CvpA family protein [Treponema sp.]|nr:CvpA family protein [Treponema sp.]
MNLPLIDLVFIILLGLLTLRGFLKGFTGEFFSIASLVLGILAAVLLFKNGAAFLRDRYFQNLSLVPEILAFLAIFLAVFFLGKVLEHIVKDIITRLNLDRLDRGLGLFLGAAEACALIVLVVFVLLIQPLFDPRQFLEKSFFVRFLAPIIGAFRV